MAKAKEIAGIDCTRQASEVVPLVLGARIEEMCSLRTRALEFSDPEGVHDIRVASRRVRSALRDFLPYLRKARVSASGRQLKEIADKLGVVRDCDVTIIALEKLQPTVTPEVAAGLERIIKAQKDRRDPARKELSRALGSRALSEFKRDFLQAVEAAILPASGAKASRMNSASYKAFATATLLKRVKDLERLSTSLYEPHKTKPLHDMRIAAKRLRYGLDLFAHCWGEPLGMFSRQVAQLQSSLGELHDCDIWIEDFGKRLVRLKTKSDDPPAPQDERDAMIWLLSHFTRLRTKHFRAALARWHEWEAKDFCERLTATLRT
jgi:CHAD domain-containing protein